MHKKKSILLSVVLIFLISCNTTKKINKALSTKEVATVLVNHVNEDSVNLIKGQLRDLKSHAIQFSTFNAKIKVESSDNKGRNPELSAVVKIVNDSAIWISLSATILNVEVYRLLVTKDSVILMDKRNKEVLCRSKEYLQEVTQIPLDYASLQNLIVGNPIFLTDSVCSYRQTESQILIMTVGDFFKNLLTLSKENTLLHCKLDDVNMSRNRTADITYSDYENISNIPFSTNREIVVSEKNKIEVKLNYKQCEFNKPLTITFNIPKNYKKG